MSKKEVDEYFDILDFVLMLGIIFVLSLSVLIDQFPAFFNAIPINIPKVISVCIPLFLIFWSAAAIYGVYHVIKLVNNRK